MLMPSVGFRPKPRPSLREFFEEGRGRKRDRWTPY
jgi:hypothetical protein